jgi:hypothetical protein
MECKICFEKYDTEDFKPIVCMPCGHSFCSKCVIQLKECSICRTQINDKKTNFSLLEVLEEQSNMRSQQSVRPISRQEETKSDLEALRLIKDGIKLTEQKKHSEALFIFNKALGVCTIDFQEKYTLLWSVKFYLVFRYKSLITNL